MNFFLNFLSSDLVVFFFDCLALHFRMIPPLATPLVFTFCVGLDPLQVEH